MKRCLAPKHGSKNLGEITKPGRLLRAKGMDEGNQVVVAVACAVACCCCGAGGAGGGWPLVFGFWFLLVCSAATCTSIVQ